MFSSQRESPATCCVTSGNLSCLSSLNSVFPFPGKGLVWVGRWVSQLLPTDLQGCVWSPGPTGLSQHPQPEPLHRDVKDTYLGALGLKRSGLKVSGSSKYVSMRPIT